MRYNDGFLIGTGAARNVELGFVPSWVRVVNLTDGDALYEGPVAQAIGFDSGGGDASNPREIKAGMKVHASDDGWEGIVGQLVLNTGSWAGGNATGWIVFEPGSLEGAANIADNDTIRATEHVDTKGTGDWGTVAGGGLTIAGVAVAAAVAKAAAATSITPYFGSHASGAKGFTIASTISEDGKLLGYQAWAKDPGSDVIDLSDG